MPSVPKRLVYLGSPEAAVAPLRALHAAGHDIAESKDAFTSILDEFETVIGEPPSFFHLNDSEGALGSNKDRHKLLEEYVKGVVGRFKDDRRVQVWDLWNEPDNLNGNSYGENHLKTELPKDVKHKAVEDLLRKTFQWAREAGATQPLTSGLWLGGHKADPKRLIPIESVRLPAGYQIVTVEE